MRPGLRMRVLTTRIPYKSSISRFLCTPLPSMYVTPVCHSIPRYQRYIAAGSLFFFVVFFFSVLTHTLTCTTSPWTTRILSRLGKQRGGGGGGGGVKKRHNETRLTPSHPLPFFLLFVFLLGLSRPLSRGPTVRPVKKKKPVRRNSCLLLTKGTSRSYFVAFVPLVPLLLSLY